MQKIKLFTLVFTVLICCQSVIGQQIYKVSDYGKPGDIYLYNRLPPVQNASALVTGSNVTWDLTAQADLSTHVSRIVTPSEGIDQFTFVGVCTLGGNSIFDCLSIWSNTEQALLIPDTLSLFAFSLTDLQRYQNKTTNKLLENFFGFTVDLGGTVQQAAIVYEAPDTILNFPIAFGNHWTSHVKWALDLSATGQNLQYESNQSRTTSVDSWGTLITPYDTFTNVIRVRSEILRQDVLTTDSLTVPINLSQVEYMWFDTNYTLPVMTANGIATDSTDILAAVQYIYEATCPTPAWTVDSDHDVYYIDHSGSVDVNFHFANSNANEYSWDFGDSSFGNSTGDITHTYYVGGEYAIAVTGCMTDCLPLNSCISEIIEFEIIDTVTSVLVVPGNELGIKLYPNPAKETVTMDIPVNLGPQQYQMLDISGREVKSGILSTGISTLDASQMDNGVYSVRLWKKDGVRDRLAVMRLAVIK
ncbi:MAG TPA: T9SS type A sorting domain-containing protein [Saprospiraceae bacterium]|nr:T9SS type A sorting domain-containing protein [Saprospiraceae bacterium]